MAWYQYEIYSFCVWFQHYTSSQYKTWKHQGDFVIKKEIYHVSSGLSLSIWVANGPRSSRAWEIITFSWHWAHWLAGSTEQKQRAPPSACELSCAGLGPVWSQHKLCWSWPSQTLPALESELSTEWTSTSSVTLMCFQESVDKIYVYQTL